MKRFLQGLMAGSLIVGAAWAAVHASTRFGIKESDAVENVIRATLESKLTGAEFLDIVLYREVPPSASDLSALRRKAKHFEVEVAYRRNTQIKRMLMPIFVDRGGWQTPAAEILERLDSQAQVTLD